MTSLHDVYLQEMGIVRWQLRQQADAQVLASDAELEVMPVPANDVNNNTLTWEELQNRVNQCQLCPLHQCRKNAVFGVGNPQADLVVIGEAPGANEDRQGEPFVGRAGKLLNLMLEAIGLSREDIFICNVLKCRPPNNRDPSKQEVKTCTPYLEQQLIHIKPKILLAVGRIAAHYLLGVEQRLASLRGRQWQFGVNHTPLIVTYHPAYLLRNPRDKRKAFQDLRLIERLLDKKSSVS